MASTWPSQRWFIKHLLFHPHVSCLLPLWGPKSLPLASSFGLSWKYLWWGFQTFWQVTDFSGSLPYIHVIQLLFYFLLLICVISLILRPSRRTKKDTGEKSSWTLGTPPQNPEARRETQPLLGGKFAFHFCLLGSVENTGSGIFWSEGLPMWSLKDRIIWYIFYSSFIM